jgi:hypothetical protein
MSKKKIQRLVFIFDANAGRAAAWMDSAKKMLMLKGCALCTITHGVLGEKKDWADCKEEIGVPVEYLHRDEVSPEIAKLPGFSLPCIVAAIEDGTHVVLVAPDVLDRCKGSVSDLKSRIFIHALSRDLEMPDDHAARQTGSDSSGSASSG